MDHVKLDSAFANDRVNVKDVAGDKLLEQVVALFIAKVLEDAP